MALAMALGLEKAELMEVVGLWLPPSGVVKVAVAAAVCLVGLVTFVAVIQQDLRKPGK